MKVSRPYPFTNIKKFFYRYLFVEYWSDNDEIFIQIFIHIILFLVYVINCKICGNHIDYSEERGAFKIALIGFYLCY
jgi:hypothetical protein